MTSVLAWFCYGVGLWKLDAVQYLRMALSWTTPICGVWGILLTFNPSFSSKWTSYFICSFSGTVRMNWWRLGKESESHFLLWGWAIICSPWYLKRHILLVAPSFLLGHTQKSYAAVLYWFWILMGYSCIACKFSHGKIVLQVGVYILLWDPKDWLL